MQIPKNWFREKNTEYILVEFVHQISSHDKDVVAKSQQRF